MTEDEFRAKYPHSTEEQVQGYVAALKAEEARAAAGVKPEPEPLGEPMPIITVPAHPPPPPPAVDIPVTTVTTYSSDRFVIRNFSLADVPPEVTPDSSSVAEELRNVLLGAYGFNLRLSAEQRHRLQTESMTENEMLAMIIGAPSEREFKTLQ